MSDEAQGSSDDRVSPAGLTAAQEHARLVAMHGNPIAATTLRTAPTLAEVAAIEADAARG